MIVHNFLRPEDICLFEELAERSHFEPGRQGTGYEKLNIRGCFPNITERALHLLYPKRQTFIEGECPGHDCYLLCYRDGAYVPLHKDDATYGFRHRRLNAIVRAPESGGVLMIDGEIVDLRSGDAEHSVSPVVGERLVFSVGVLL